MTDTLENYFNELINQIGYIAQISLELEQRLYSIQDRKDSAHDFVISEVSELKAVINQLDFFVQQLIDKFSYLSSNTASFITTDEFDNLKSKVNKLDFENLRMRKVWKDKVYKSEI